MANKLILTVHDSKGFHMLEGFPKFGEEFLNFESSGTVKLYKTSENGKKVALIANGCVQVLCFPKWNVQHKINQPTAQDLKFSPKGEFLAVYCAYLKKDGKSVPNLHVYSLQGGECVLLKSFFQANQMGWEPQWSGDDKVFCRSVNNEVHFFHADKLDATAHKRLQQKVKQFSISPSSGNHSVVFFTPCVKSNPCLVNMFSYPNFEAGDLPLVTKNFFKGDSVEFKWNKNCTTVLVSAFAEKPDKTSYYGQTMLYLLSSKTQEAVVVEFPRDSPIADACWAPDGKELFVIHGHNPATCSILNTSGDIVHNLKPGSRNFVMMNPQGNLALIGAMGNMSPKMEVWNVASRTELQSAPLPDMTAIEWSPCGQYFITATCAPRLRVLNGFRIYHYSGALKYEEMVPKGMELYSAKWLPDLQAAKNFKASAKVVDGIQSTIKVASSQAYVPPGQRGQANPLPQGLQGALRFLNQLDKYDPNSPAALANAPAAPPSKNALRNKKKRENKKQKGEGDDAVEISEPDFGAVKGEKKSKPAEVKSEVKLAGDGQKAITAINKKLKRIRVINQLRAEGKQLDAQQQTLVDSEKELLAQLSSLKV